MRRPSLTMAEKLSASDRATLSQENVAGISWVELISLPDSVAQADCQNSIVQGDVFENTREA